MLERDIHMNELHGAIRNMDIEAIEELLEKNPNLVNARRADLCGFTPLELVV